MAPCKGCTAYFNVYSSVCAKGARSNYDAVRFGQLSGNLEYIIGG